MESQGATTETQSQFDKEREAIEKEKEKVEPRRLSKRETMRDVLREKRGIDVDARAFEETVEATLVNVAAMGATLGMEEMPLVAALTLVAEDFLVHNMTSTITTLRSAYYHGRRITDGRLRDFAEEVTAAHAKHPDAGD